MQTPVQSFASIAKKTMCDFIKQCSNIRSELHALRSEALDHRHASGRGRLASGTMGVCGGMLLASTPFTFGMGALVGGIVLGVASAGVGAGTAIGRSQGDRDHVRRLQGLADQLTEKGHAVQKALIDLVQSKLLERGWTERQISQASVGKLANAANVGVGLLGHIEGSVPVSADVLSLVSEASSAEMRKVVGPKTDVELKDLDFMFGITYSGCYLQNAACQGLSQTMKGVPCMGVVGGIVGVYDLVQAARELHDKSDIEGLIQKALDHLTDASRAVNDSLADVDREIS